MTETENIYQSILLKIGSIPLEYLQQVDDYLKTLDSKITSEKTRNRNEILSLAGGWSDLNDSDFDDVIKKAKETGNDMFKNRDIEL